MRVLVIMKRFGANKDMVMQNFGRQVRLFESLSKLGRKIDFLCPDYKKFENKDIKRNKINFYIRPYSPLNHFQFIKILKNLIKKNKYDFIVSTTDPLIGILGYRYSKKFDVKHIYDMQDEYSSYDAYKIPFIKNLDKKAVKNSDIVITVSDSLNKYVKKNRKKPTYTIQNGIDLGLFKKIDKSSARKILKLPKGRIIVYTGEISRFKGVDILIHAFNKIRQKYPNTYLLLSGKINKNINIKQKNIIFREFPKREELALGINAADVAVVPNPKNKFTEYCFPYKLCEYMACNVPIVATNVGDVSVLLKKNHGSLCKPNDVEDLSEKIIAALKRKRKVNYRNDLRQFTWKKLSKKLDKIIREIQK
tara:strand:- start:2656 stop:3744 length:1089 start_codon:yes stop_codon:yes gene_type:complete